MVGKEKSPLAEEQLIEALSAADAYGLTPQQLKQAIAKLNLQTLSPSLVDEAAIVCGVVARQSQAVLDLKRYLAPAVHRAVKQAGGATHEAEEALQYAIAELVTVSDGATKLESSYQSGRLKKFASIIASRHVLGAHKKQRAAVKRESEYGQLVLGPAIAAVEPQVATDIRAAVRDAMAALDDRAKNIVYLHYLKSTKLASLATTYDVDRSTVVRWLAKAREQILEGCRRELADKGYDLSGETWGALFGDEWDMTLSSILRVDDM